MPPFVQLATILSGSQYLLESGGSKSIATINSGRQRTPRTPAERVTSGSLTEPPTHLSVNSRLDEY